MKRAVAFAVVFGLVLCSLVGCNKSKSGGEPVTKSEDTKAKMMSIGQETKAAMGKMGGAKGGAGGKGGKAEAGGQ